MTDTEIKMIKNELNKLAKQDEFSNIHECTLKLINLYEAIILGNQMEIEELKKNALVWHKVTCFDKPDENECITYDAPAYDYRNYLVRTKRGHYSIQELMEVDSGVVFEDCEWEDVDAWTELPEV